MNTYRIYFGNDLRTLRTWETEATSEYQAKMLFREKFGYDHIKIQKVELLED